MSEKPATVPAGSDAIDFDRAVQPFLNPSFFQRCVWEVSKGVVRCWARVYFRLSVRGRHNFPEGPMIAIANHLSHLDPPLIGSYLPKMTPFIAKEPLFRVPVLRSWLHAVGAIPVRQGAADSRAMKISLEVLRRGGPIILFPEGSRSKDGKPQPAQTGISMMATKFPDIPIVPIRIEGSFEAMPVGAKLPRPHKVSIIVGKPFRIGELQGMPEEKKALYRALADEMMRRIVDARP